MCDAISAALVIYSQQIKNRKPSTKN